MNLQQDLGLLFLRLFIGSFMLFGHGLGKLLAFSSVAQHFPDPLHVSPVVSLSFAVFAEVFCSLAVIVGFKTRLFAIPVAITMVVAAAMIHIDDPWHKKEFALLYAIPFLALALTGPGRFSLDYFFKKGRA